MKCRRPSGLVCVFSRLNDVSAEEGESLYDVSGREVDDQALHERQNGKNLK